MSSITTPFHQHADFKELDLALATLSLGVDALNGIASMMQPIHLTAEEYLDGTRRSDAASVFEFFGKVLAVPMLAASNAADRLHMAAYDLDQGD